MSAKEISEKIKTERQLRATTGLNYKQFSALLPVFEQHLEKAIQDKYKNKLCTRQKISHNTRFFSI